MCSSRMTPRIEPVFVSTMREEYRGPALVNVTRQASVPRKICKLKLVIGHDRLRLVCCPCRARILAHAALTNSSLILVMRIALLPPSAAATTRIRPPPQTDKSVSVDLCHEFGRFGLWDFVCLVRWC